MNQPNLIPKNKHFWFYHLGIILTLSGLQCGFYVASLQGRILMFNLAAWLGFVILFTLSMLLFRKIYFRRNWKTLTTTRIIFLALCYAAVSGFCITSIVLAALLPPFWKDLFPAGFLEKYQLTSFMAATSVMISNWVQLTILSCLWIFMYTSITGKRSIREAEISNLHLQNNLKESQLLHLANQLNPHFLFNALNNIRFMIHEDSQRADQMIVNLSDILRYSLSASSQEKVRLSSEIEVALGYIDLVKIQFEQRLRFEIHIEEDLGHYLIPPMIIQLLIENAIKHGVDELRFGGALKLAIFASETQLICELINDKPSKVSHKNSIGLGLNNIAKRLELLYGDSAQLQCESSTHQFTVTLSLPKENSE